jgi:hypothetical protein
MQDRICLEGAGNISKSIMGITFIISYNKNKWTSLYDVAANSLSLKLAD